MSTKIKGAKVTTEKGEVVTFNVEDMRAVKGLKKSFFDGQVKVVHKVQAKKLIDAKLAEEVKAELVKEENPNRSVKDIKE